MSRETLNCTGMRHYETTTDESNSVNRRTFYWLFTKRVSSEA